jgi:carbamoyltransferase
MGLAPYGEPRYVDRDPRHLIDVKDDGTFRLDLSYFDYLHRPDHDQRRSSTRCSAARRARPSEQLTQRHMDLAASLQAVTEEVVLRLTRVAARRRPASRTCAWPAAWRSTASANGKVLRDKHFENIWVQPAAGDAGGALGRRAGGLPPAGPAAHRERPGDAMKGSLPGPGSMQADIEARLTAAGAKFEVMSDDAIVDECRAADWPMARPWAGSRAAWSSARARWACRSILGDPRSPTMQKQLNLKVKYRESFRPFAPSVLRENVADWFEIDGDSPYMLLVARRGQAARRAMTEEENKLFGIDKLNVPRSDIPAVTHVDYSARIQTVHERDQPALSRADVGVRAPHRLPGAGEHQLQRARRADRLHAPRTRSAASWAPRWTSWPSATACCARSSRTRRSS